MGPSEAPSLEASREVFFLSCASFDVWKRKKRVAFSSAGCNRARRERREGKRKMTQQMLPLNMANSWVEIFALQAFLLVEFGRCYNGGVAYKIDVLICFLRC